jgi:hypothetical protein
VAIDDVPGEIYVGNEVVLTASTESQGGTYVWSVNKGSGSIAGSGASAIFVGDQAGEVEIKVAYTPPDGGEPCKDFYTLQVKDECSVTIAGDSDVAVGSHIKLEAMGQPAGGSYEWLYADGLLAMGDEAFFTGNSPGQIPVTVRYRTPEGSVCSDSHTITAYKVENISPKTACFDSGKILSASDFQVLTAPPGYEDRINFMPATASTMLQSEEVEVTGSCGEGTADDAITRVTVVNSDVKTTKAISVNIPDVISDALGLFGFSDKIKFNFVNSYTSFTECCIDGPDISSAGKTALNVEADFAGATIYGVPIYAPMKEYVTIDLLQLNLSGGGSVSINGEYKSCSQEMYWSGQGDFSVNFSLSSEARANFSRCIVLQGKVAGKTVLNEKIVVSNNELMCSGGWGGIKLTGTVLVLIGDYELLSDYIEYNIVKSKTIPAFSSELPSMY